MPVPCRPPCSLCGDVECFFRSGDGPVKLDWEHVPLMSQAEAEKFLREHSRSDSDFKSAVLNSLKGGEKK